MNHQSDPPSLTEKETRAQRGEVSPKVTQQSGLCSSQEPATDLPFGFSHMGKVTRSPRLALPISRMGELRFQVRSIQLAPGVTSWSSRLESRAI
jgi:hypothetical protein